MPVKGPTYNLNVGRGLSLAELGDSALTNVQSGRFDIKSCIGNAVAARHDFVVIPLATPGGQGVGADFQPSVESALSLDNNTWSTRVVGVVSDEIGSAGSLKGVSASAAVGALTGSLALDAEAKRECLQTELRWASHLGLRSVLLPAPLLGDTYSFARSINELLLAGIADGDEEGMALVVRVPPTSDGWSAWNRMRLLCDHHQKLSVALEFPADLSATDRELHRWRGEPVKYAMIPSEVFIPNKSGYPVLPKKHKALLLDLMDHRVQIVLTGGSAEETSVRTAYIARLFQQRPAPTEAELFAQDHLNHLQAPLQPLADNLESGTYEIFEKDPIKYFQYEEAVYEFLADRKAAGRAESLVVMVLGAGRGPLVAAALRAAVRAEVVLTLWAVEKNPNAIHALRHRQRTDEAWKSVEIVAQDMRTWDAPRKADCIISELLGSFGDNELSPECLDGAQRVMADDGVSIPSRYVSTLTPVSCARLWEEARGRGQIADLEQGYVVRIHSGFYPSSPIKECFAFQHPNRPLSSNERYIELEFEVEVDSLIHGFAGYFDCDLYGKARISIHPPTFSEGMFSWFEMFFPLTTPVSVKKGDTIRTHWWRRVDSKKVWYEWSLSEPVATPLQNPGGRSYAIGL